ncbi:hypothetical protein F5Y15DRAFT_389165 [Xylariaceae sp. FL0016]|nr:hypothetical protein F5Y15DRAFT_389165 [Xylariaceae sp. FL0016]
MGKRRRLAQPPQPKHGAGSQKHPPPKTAHVAAGKGPPGKSQTPPKKNKKKNQPNPQHAEPTIPFAPEDKILLVGDGDLSFAASLVTHHYCADVTATVLETSREELLAKYPHAADNIAQVEADDSDSRVLYGVDATKMAPFAPRGKKGAPDGGSGSGVGVMDRIIFNFPHVGGKSTDVNRQVRYNQELLVSFFGRAAPSLAPGGTIVVTLFEGEPYTLWNIRDLARHSGLQVERSFRFQAAAYPGYHHARTLGVVKNKDGESGGGWRGEERAARSYVFVRKGEEGQAKPAMKSRKRGRGGESDSSDDE